MFNIRDIVARDAATYYRDDPVNRVSRWPLLIKYAITAAIVAVIVQVASSDFLAGMLSAQAILVGFSFNVLFYPVANRLTAPARWTSIDHELRFERLSRLSDEIFDNITYFNVVAIGSAVGCLVLLLIDSKRFENNLTILTKLASVKTGVNVTTIEWIGDILQIILLAVLIFLLTESVSTFLRAVGRVRFYFTMFKTMNDAAGKTSTP